MSHLQNGFEVRSAESSFVPVTHLYKTMHILHYPAFSIVMLFRLIFTFPGSYGQLMMLAMQIAGETLVELYFPSISHQRRSKWLRSTEEASKIPSSKFKRLAFEGKAVRWWCRKNREASSIISSPWHFDDVMKQDLVFMPEALQIYVWSLLEAFPNPCPPAENLIKTLGRPVSSM